MSTENEGRTNPCLLEYDSQVCGRCKFGMARIFDNEGVYCGYVSDIVETKNEDGDVIDTQYQCSLDDSYSTKSTSSVYYMTNKYSNHTTGYTEYLCYEIEPSSQSDTSSATGNSLLKKDSDSGIDYALHCSENGMKRWMETEVWDSLSTEEQQRAILTIGCKQCDTSDGTNYYL